MSSFLDEVAAEVKQPGTQQCGVAKVLDEITDADLRAGVLATIRDRSFPASAIDRALKKRDIRLPASTIGHHRRDDCRCPQETKPPREA